MLKVHPCGSMCYNFMSLLKLEDWRGGGMRWSGLSLHGWQWKKAEQGCHPPALQEVKIVTWLIPCHFPRLASGVIDGATEKQTSHPNLSPDSFSILPKMQGLGDWLDLMVRKSAESRWEDLSIIHILMWINALRSFSSMTSLPKQIMELEYGVE